MDQLDAQQTGYQEVKGSIPAGSSYIILWKLIMKYFFMIIFCLLLNQDGQLSTDSRWAVVSFWQKNVHKYWLIA